MRAVWLGISSLKQHTIVRHFFLPWNPLETPFQFNGLALKQGEKFVHNLNVNQIKCVEVKLTKVRQDIEAQENKKRSYDNTFMGTHK